MKKYRIRLIVAEGGRNMNIRTTYNLGVIGMLVGAMSIIISFAVMTLVKNSRKTCHIVTSENYVFISLSESDRAEFGISLSDFYGSDYLDVDSFSFSYLDIYKNKVDKSPVEVTEVKTGRKRGWCTAIISAQMPGVYYIRISHNLTKLSIDVPVFVTLSSSSEGEE